MKLKDMIKNIDDISINNDFVNKVEEVYSGKLSDFVKRILSTRCNYSFVYQSTCCSTQPCPD